MVGFPVKFKENLSKIATGMKVGDYHWQGISDLNEINSQG